MIDRRGLLTVGLAALASRGDADEVQQNCGNGPVRTEDKAVAVARQALVARYGAEAVAAQEPLHAPLGPQAGRWMIVGTVTGEQIGGNFNVLVDEASGCVLAAQIDT